MRSGVYNLLTASSSPKNGTVLLNLLKSVVRGKSLFLIHALNWNPRDYFALIYFLILKRTNRSRSAQRTHLLLFLFLCPTKVIVVNILRHRHGRSKTFSSAFHQNRHRDLRIIVRRKRHKPAMGFSFRAILRRPSFSS